MSALEVVSDGHGLLESPRWVDGRLWVCDWLAGEVLAFGGGGGEVEVVARLETFPFCLGVGSDGRVLVVSGGDGRLLRLEADGSLSPVADLSALSPHPWNEVVVAPDGGAWVNGIGFAFGEGEPGPGQIAYVPGEGGGGAPVEVAGGLAFPNGMALTPDGRTLIVAESFAGLLTAFDVGAGGALSGRRVWAAVEGAAPDGICLDAEGAVWFADVPNARCVRVAEGGEVLTTVEVDRGCFSCALGGEDGATLYIAAATWDPTTYSVAPGTGRVLATRAPAPAA